LKERRQKNKLKKKVMECPGDGISITYMFHYGNILKDEKK